MTTASKWRQLLQLEDIGYRVRMDFNRRFLALRDRKELLCKSLTADAATLQGLYAKLGEPYSPPTFPRLPSEWPEDLEKVIALHVMILSHD